MLVGRAIYAALSHLHFKETHIFQTVMDDGGSVIKKLHIINLVPCLEMDTIRTSFSIVTFALLPWPHCTSAQQNAVTFTSISVAFVTFVGIVIYRLV